MPLKSEDRFSSYVPNTISGEDVIPKSPSLPAELRKNKAANNNNLNTNSLRYSIGKKLNEKYQKISKLDPITVSQFMNNVKEGSTTSIPGLLMSSSTIKDKSPSRKEAIQKIESFWVVNCAQHIPEPQRGTNIRKALDDLGRLYPGLSSILLSIQRYMKEQSTSIENLQESHKVEIKNLEQSIYKKYESFFEEKTIQLIRDKRKAELITKQLRETVLKLRKERDEDLMKVKETVMLRLNDCERKEDEFSSFRKLIASVFKTNEGLVNRVEDLEVLLRKHRIDIPRVNEDLFAYSKPKGENTLKLREEDDVKKIQDQVPIAFIEASRQEMNLARLSLQRELLNSAFDDRTAYRLQVNSLRNENSILKSQIESLQGEVIELERYIHEKRFLSCGINGRGEPLTPRPKDIPFAVRTDLGIDLKNSTSRIVAELAAVGTNLKHQLNSAVMSFRQLTSVLEWIEGETMLKIAEQSNYQGVLPTFPSSVWDSIPHFLRTHIEPDVPNLGWTEIEVASLLYDFFSNYYSLRNECRFSRDSKMLTPRVYQLFERCSHPLVRLDATQADVQQSEENVPFGYIISHFVSKMIKSATSESSHAKLLQPGTLNPNFLNNGEMNPIELEFGKYSYNLWYSSQRYKDQQPLCRLFIEVLDGRLSVKLFDIMQRVLKVVESRIRKFDVEGCNTFTYNKLVNSVLKLVADMDAQVGRCATLAVMETFKINEVPLVGGRLFIPAILADETCVEKTDSPRVSRRRSVVGSRIRRKSNIMEQIHGASILTRFWRRLVIQRHERVYSILERILGPLVVESQVVIGLFLLPVPSAIQAVKEFDENRLGITEDYMNTKYPFLAENDLAKYKKVSLESDAPEAPRFTGEYARLLAERGASIRELKDISIEDFLKSVLEGVQTLSRSVHFPLHSPKSEKTLTESFVSTTLESPNNNNSSKKDSPQKKNTIKKKASKARLKGKKSATNKQDKTEDNPLSVSIPDIIPKEMTVNTDKEMVEWYGLCFAIRQTLVSLPENIFLEESVVQLEKSAHTSIFTEIPVLSAEEFSRHDNS